MSIKIIFLIRLAKGKKLSAIVINQSSIVRASDYYHLTGLCKGIPGNRSEKKRIEFHPRTLVAKRKKTLKTLMPKTTWSGDLFFNLKLYALDLDMCGEALPRKHSPQITSFPFSEQGRSSWTFCSHYIHIYHTEIQTLEPLISVAL